MTEIPPFVIAALEQAGYESPYYKPVTNAFMEHWGDLEPSTFVRALQEGGGVDKLISIFVMTNDDTDQVRQLLLALLQSVPLERWASALVLGERKEESAIPSLMTMLTEFLPPNTQYQTGGYLEWRFDNWRSDTARLLGEWERVELASGLYEALVKLWQMEQSFAIEKRLDVTSLQKQYWRNCQRQLVYALGQIEQFELVREMVVPQSRLNVWMVYLALGHLRAQSIDPKIFQTVLRSTVISKGQIFDVLENQLGLSKEEREQCWVDLREEILR